LDKRAVLGGFFVTAAAALGYFLWRGQDTWQSPSSGGTGVLTVGSISTNLDLSMAKLDQLTASDLTHAERQRIDSLVFANLKNSMIPKEGLRYDVYRDSLGKLTVGLGHLVVPSDGLKLGDVISKERVDAFFTADIVKAFDAARTQAIALPAPYSVMWIDALTHVNFQLGTGWIYEHTGTWAALKSGNAKKAIWEVTQNSEWAKQTPERTAYFANAIKQAYNVA
jgi:GH24 family phage-related lysozyme (muramidase)